MLPVLPTQGFFLIFSVRKKALYGNLILDILCKSIVENVWFLRFCFLTRFLQFCAVRRVKCCPFCPPKVFDVFVQEKALYGNSIIDFFCTSIVENLVLVIFP